MEEIISLREIIDILRKRLGLILLSGLLGLGLAFVVTTLFITPAYQSSTELIAQSKNAATDPTVNQQVDINGNLMLINTYKDMIMGDVVLTEVQKELTYQGYKLTPTQIRSMLNVAQSEQSQMFRITATSDEPRETSAIANTTAKVFQEKTQEVLGIDRVTVTSPAITPTEPVSPNKKLNMTIGTIVGLALGTALAFLLAFLDKTVKDKRFIAETLELPVLGQVSEMNKKELARAKKIGGKMKKNVSVPLESTAAERTERTRKRV